MTQESTIVECPHLSPRRRAACFTKQDYTMAAYCCGCTPTKRSSHPLISCSRASCSSGVRLAQAPDEHHRLYFIGMAFVRTSAAGQCGNARRNASIERPRRAREIRAQAPAMTGPRASPKRGTGCGGRNTPGASARNGWRGWQSPRHATRSVSKEMPRRCPGGNDKSGQYMSLKSDATCCAECSPPSGRGAHRACRGGAACPHASHGARVGRANCSFTRARRTARMSCARHCIRTHTCAIVPSRAHAFNVHAHAHSQCAHRHMSQSKYDAALSPHEARPQLCAPGVLRKPLRIDGGHVLVVDDEDMQARIAMQLVEASHGQASGGAIEQASRARCAAQNGGRPARAHLPHPVHPATSERACFLSTLSQRLTDKVVLA